MKPLTDRPPLAMGMTGPGARTRQQAHPALWLMPLILVLGVFYLYPVLDVFRFAFSDITLLGKGEHVTIETLLKTLTRPELAEILWVTLVFTGASVIGQQVLGLAVALVVVRARSAVSSVPICFAPLHSSPGLFRGLRAASCGRC